MNNLWILAQATGAGTQEQEASGITAEPVESGAETTAVVAAPNRPSPQQPAPQRAPQYNMLIFLGLMFVMLYFIMFRSPRKKEQRQRQMIKSLKKNDRVCTIGGIIGTVIDVRDDEITLKVDESSNTKIKIIPAAVTKKVSQDRG